MLIIGHRGARKEAPENTIPSFKHAQDSGCVAFELDIQLSRDLGLVVFHDTTLSRTTGKRGRLSSFSQNRLEQIDARYHTARWGEKCPIPSLEGVISSTTDVVHWQFEVKTDSWIKLYILHHKLARLITRYGLQDTATITSFDKRLLRLVQQNYPTLRTGLVSDEGTEAVIADAKELSCHLLAVNRLECSGKLIQQAKKAGLEISTWTVNEVAEAQTMKEWGMDSLITDCPSIMLKEFVSN